MRHRNMTSYYYGEFLLYVEISFKYYYRQNSIYFTRFQCMYIYTMYHVHMTNQNPSTYFTRPCWGHLHPTRKSDRKYLIFGLVQDFYVSFVPDQIEKKPRLICVIENPPQPVTVEFLPQILKMRIVDGACVHSTQFPTMFSLFVLGLEKRTDLFIIR